MSKRIAKIIRKLEEKLNKREKTIKFEKYDIQIFFSDDEKIIVCNSFCYEELYYIYLYLVNRGIKIDCITNNLLDIFCLNNIGIIDIDYSYLNKLYKFIKQNNLDTELEVIDANLSIIPYEDYISLFECLKWYRQIIDESKLSPFEKVIFAYDICKTFAYSWDALDTNENAENANTLYLVIKTGKIICLGYNVLLEAILAGIDDNIRFSSVYVFCPENHARGVVRIDDDKYNIHGFYYLDPTWDSIHKDYEDYYGQKYNALSAYRYFLVPLSKYKNFYAHDTYPLIIFSLNFETNYSKPKEIERLNNRIDGKREIYFDLSYSFQSLVDEDVTFKEFYKYLNCERPKTSVMANAITNVRLAEGYKIEDMNSLVFGINTNRKDKPYILNKKNLKKINR